MFFFRLWTTQGNIPWNRRENKFFWNMRAVRWGGHWFRWRCWQQDAWFRYRILWEDEVDYSSCSVTSASDIMVPAANVHSSSSGNPFFIYSVHSKNKSPIWRWKSTDKPREYVQYEITPNILEHFSSDSRSFGVFGKERSSNQIRSTLSNHYKEIQSKYRRLWYFLSIHCSIYSSLNIQISF